MAIRSAPELSIRSGGFWATNSGCNSVAILVDGLTSNVTPSLCFLATSAAKVT